MVLRRKSRSWRKRPAATSCAQVGVGGGEDAHVHARACARSRRARTRPSPARAAAWPAGSRGTFAISSRKSVPPSASSKRPTRSALASVKAPFTWPNSSLSKTPSESPPALTAGERPRRARGGGVQRARDRALARAVLAGDEHVGVRGADARDHLQHRLHGRRLRDERSPALRRAARGSPPPAARPRRSARPARPACAATVSSRALSHGFCTKSRAPRRMASTARSTLAQAVITTTGSVGSMRLQAGEQVEPLLPGGGVARVVEVHQHDVELARLAPRAPQRRGRGARSRARSPRPSAAGAAPRRMSGWSSATRMRAAAGASWLGRHSTRGRHA